MVKLKMDLDHWKAVLDMRQAERKAYSEVFDSRCNEFAVGKADSPDFMLDAQARLAAVLAKESEATVEYRRLLRLHNAATSEAIAPVRVHGGVGP
jgi:hypothetical protein